VRDRGWDARVALYFYQTEEIVRDRILSPRHAEVRGEISRFADTRADSSHRANDTRTRALACEFPRSLLSRITRVRALT